MLEFAGDERERLKLSGKVEKIVEFVIWFCQVTTFCMKTVRKINFVFQFKIVEFVFLLIGRNDLSGNE